MKKYISLLFISYSLYAESIELLVKQNDIAQIRQLSFGELNAQDAFGMAALHQAAFYDRAEIIQELVERKVVLDACNEHGMNPFEIALMHGNLECAELLYNAMMADYPDMLFHQPLSLTIADIVNVQPGKNTRDFLKNVLLHAESNQSLPAYNRAVLQPKYYLCMTKIHSLSVQMRQRIIDLCASKNKHGLRDLLRTLSILERHYAFFVVLNNGSKGIEMLKVASEFISNIDFCVDRYQTALTHACWNENYEQIDFLISKGADVNHVCLGDDGRTPLIYVAEKGNLNIARKLIAAGADPKLPRNSDITPCMTAARWGKTGLMEYLLQFDDINAVSSAKQTALIFAANMGHVDSVRALLNAGADVTCVTDKGFTALHVAANFENHREANRIVRLLLDTKKVDIEALDHEYRTPLMIAIIAKNPGAVRLLVDNGANVLYVHPTENFSCYNLAKFFSTEEIQEIIVQAIRARGS